MASALLKLFEKFSHEMHCGCKKQLMIGDVPSFLCTKPRAKRSLLSRPGSLNFLLENQIFRQTMTVYLKSNSGNVTDGMTFTTETGNQNFIVFFNVVQATVPRNEGSDFLAVLDELDTDALTDGGVRLLSFNTTATRRNISLLLTKQYFSSMTFTDIFSQYNPVIGLQNHQFH